MCRIASLVLLAATIALVGCIGMVGKKAETDASRVAERVATQQAVTVEKASRLETPQALEVSVPVFQPTVSVPDMSSGRMSRDKNTNPASFASAVTIRIPPKSDTTISARSAGDISASGTASSSFSSIQDISTGWKLILFAVGLGLLTLVVQFIRSRYKAVDVAISKIDEVVAVAETKLANRINSLKEQGLRSTNPEESVKIAAEVAYWNEERGKLKSEATKIRDS